MFFRFFTFGLSLLTIMRVWTTYTISVCSKRVQKHVAISKLCFCVLNSFVLWLTVFLDYCFRVNKPGNCTENADNFYMFYLQLNIISRNRFYTLYCSNPYFYIFPIFCLYCCFVYFDDWGLKYPRRGRRQNINQKSFFGKPYDLGWIYLLSEPFYI